jgi:hypothetical protein
MRFKFLKIILLIFFMGSLSIQADAKGNASKKRLYRYLTKKSFQVGMGVGFWQQEVGLYQRGATEKMNVSYKGVELNANYVKPSRKNIHWIYGLNAKVTFGQAKGLAQGAINEDFGNQNFTDFQFSPTVLYRSSLRTEFGLYFPIGYRMTFWQPPVQRDISAEDENLFYYGYGLTMITRYNLKNAIVISAAYQHNIGTARWSIGWQYDIK